LGFPPPFFLERVPIFQNFLIHPWSCILIFDFLSSCSFGVGINLIYFKSFLTDCGLFSIIQYLYIISLMSLTHCKRVRCISSGIMISLCILFVEYMYRNDCTGTIAIFSLVQLVFRGFSGH
jgi:hypothetical protein